MRVKSYHKKSKTGLITSFILLLLVKCQQISMDVKTTELEIFKHQTRILNSPIKIKLNRKGV